VPDVAFCREYILVPLVLLLVEYKLLPLVQV